MNKNNIITSAIGLLFTCGVFALQPCRTEDACLLEKIIYLDEEADIDLGFDTADYLPEDFDPYTFYLDLNSVVFIDDDETAEISLENLPENFNPYAIPTDFRHISYIDPRDEILPVIDQFKIAPGNPVSHISK